LHLSTSEISELDLKRNHCFFATCRHGRLEVQSQVQLCCSSAGPHAEVKRATCLPDKCLTQAGVRIARGRGAGRVCAPAGCCLALHTASQPTSRVLPCRLAGARRPQRAACGISTSWASKRFNRVYKRCAYSAHHAHRVYRIRASSGLTARHVIYRRAASRPWRINVFSRRLPTCTCKAGLRNRTVRRATGKKSSMVCGASVALCA